MNEQQFIYYLEQEKILINKKQKTQLDIFCKFLQEYNERVNLTAITKTEEIYLKHFYDSVCATKVCDFSEKNIKVCDFGTGAGFPGIVLKIFFPNIELHLVESIEKKVEFLNLLVKKLEFENVFIYKDRMEDHSLVNKEKYDIVIARAVAKLDILLELCCQSIKINGYFIAMKSQMVEELENAINISPIFGIEFVEQNNYNLPMENSKRTLIKFQKKTATNDKYPRKFSKIKKFSLKR